MTTLPFLLNSLDGLALLCILPNAIQNLVALTLLECCLAITLADAAIKTTYTRLYLIGDIILLGRQLDTPLASDSRLVSKTVLTLTVTPNLVSIVLKTPSPPSASTAVRKCASPARILSQDCIVPGFGNRAV
jgi:hypothetical protein